MGKTFQRPEALADTMTHYCPGCTHGVAHRLVAEVIDDARDQAGEDEKGKDNGHGRGWDWEFGCWE